MRDLAALVVFLVVVVGTAVSKPLWSTLAGNNYLYPSPGINAQLQYLAAYQNAHSPYYVYNIHTNVGDIPSTVLTGGKPAYGFYYGTPIYDLRIPLSPIYPVLSPHPGLVPRPTLPPTRPPLDEDDDGIEKLDAKVDPNAGTKKPGNSEQDDDSITVEAI